jgi:hypothetical protein
MTFFLIFTMFRPDPGFNPGLLHFCSFAFLLFVLFCPFDVLYKSSRFFFLQTLGEMLISPLSDVKFQHFFLADFATSTVRVLFDLEYSMCFYVTGAFLGGTLFCPDIRHRPLTLMQGPRTFASVLWIMPGGFSPFFHFGGGLPSASG